MFTPRQCLVKSEEVVEEENNEVEEGCMVLKNEEETRLQVTSQNVIRYLKGPSRKDYKKQHLSAPKLAELEDTQPV